MLFNTDIDVINAQISDFKAAEAAIQHAVSLAFHQSYYTEDGIYDMKSYSTDVLEAIVREGARIAAAEATAGGVPLTEVKLDTLESRLCPGLFFAGEVLDVDGRIGGFNFQWAWASGFIAGHGVVGTMP